MNVNLIIFSFYLIGILIIALIANRRCTSHEGFLIGDRSLNTFNAAISAGAADMSAWMLLALPGAVYIYGLNQIWIAIGLTIGACTNWSVISHGLRRESTKVNAMTISDFLAKKVNDNGITTRFICSLMIVIFFTIYIASGFTAGAKVLSDNFNFSYHSALFTTFFIIATIITIGGFLAVSYGEVFSGLIIVCVIIIIPTLSFMKLDTMHKGIIDSVLSYNPNALNPFYNMSLVGIVSLLAWGLGYFGQPHILAKFMAMKEGNNYRTSRNIAITWMFLGLFFAIIVGFLGSAIFSSNPLADPELVLLEIAKYVLNPYFLAFIIIAVMASIIDVANAQLLVVSSVFTNDLKIVKSTVTMNRIIIVIVGLVAVLLAWNPDRTILSMVSYAWAGFGACFGPLIILCVKSSKPIQKIPAITGIIVGGLTVILWNTARAYLPEIEMFKLYELLPAFLLSFFSIYLLNFKKFG